MVSPIECVASFEEGKGLDWPDGSRWGEPASFDTGREGASAATVCYYATVGVSWLCKQRNTNTGCTRARSHETVPNAPD